MPINWLKKAFSAKDKAANLHDQVVKQNKRIRILIDEQDKLTSWNTQYVDTLSMLTEAIQAMVWKKDVEHRYVLANPHHCRSFFGFDGSSDCLVYVVGKTDKELIDTMFTERKIQNSFTKVCCLSDEYCTKKTFSTHFLEAGKIDSDQMLLYTIKTPRFNDEGEFIGSIGMAWDVTSRSAFLTEQLNRWIYDKLATKIFHDKDAFCYAIVPELNQCGIFRHVCPNPHIIDEGEVENCNICEDNGGCFRKKGKLS